MKPILRSSPADYKQKKAIGDGRYYLRGKMHETADEVLCIETVVNHNPTAADISAINAEAAATWEEFSHDRDLAEIDSLKKQLADTDYKVIKNSEWAETTRQVTGSYPNEGYPYDPQELHEEREAIRERIRELEGE